ncbi:MAG TPA: permease [Candidatus Omnitrophica bacterium]|nr:permease [Candidatus Omnitrophota bacterium]
MLKVSKEQKKEARKNARIYFLGFIIFLYLALFFINPKGAHQSLKTSLNLAIKLIPTLLIVLLLMGVMNYFLTPKRISKYLGGDPGLQGWILAATAGIISHGSIFLWYPILGEIKDKGINPGLIAVFLYNRAVKIPLIPLLAYYFGLKFVIVLTIWMVVSSFCLGKIIELIEK